MTSMNSESVSSILVSCKQTRFHIDTPNYRELDIEGLNITVTSGDTSSGKGKGRSRAEGTEILSNATLRLKASQRYALIGRNGSGKSTLLKAIAEKLIPGIPEKTRVAILQQTSASDANTDDISPGASTTAGLSHDATVLKHVVDKATAKNELEQEINALSTGINSPDPYGGLRSLRKLRHDRLQKQHFVLDKDARLRSGARGLQARKALIEGEKTVKEAETLLNQPDNEISSDILQAEVQEAADLLAELQIQVEPARLADIESRAKKILAGLGFSEAYMSKPISSLSGGWRMRTALATTLLQETDILILDEPTNFLDLLGIIWLQRYLQSLEDHPDAPTLIVVSHDRDFISLATDLLIIKDKGLTYFHGDLPMYETSQSERKIYLTKMKDAQEKQKAYMQESISHNMKQGKKSNDENKIRQAKSRQKKLDDRMGLQVSAKGGRFKLNRDLLGYHLTSRADINIPQDERPVTLDLPEPTDLRFPGSLISIEGAFFRYANKGTARGAPQPSAVLQDINLSVSMGDRIGIVGLNGSGKTTLVNLLVEAAKPTRGTVMTHPRLKLAHYAQHAVEALLTLARAEPELTALALLLREAAGELDEGELRGLLGSLGLPGRLASDMPLRRLSGGQLVRCELARLLWRRPHCLVLDEVTTHLDYGTVTALREALCEWEGAVVLVSHDRWFMRGAVEGLVDDEMGSGSGSDGGADGEEERYRRRAVYRLKGGEMKLLEGGSQEFENIVEKRARKLLRD